MSANLFKMYVNDVLIQDENVHGEELLIDYLHEKLGSTGTKFSCGVGSCGSCKVVVQEQEGAPWLPVLACYARLRTINGMRIRTVEGIGSAENLHVLQKTFLDNFAFQCGYSTPGFLMAGYALMDQLRSAPVPRERLRKTVMESIKGHICRCTGYVRYFNSIVEVIESTPGLVTDSVSDDPVADLGIIFRAMKQSFNDLEEKTVIGRFDQKELRGRVTFDGSVRADSCLGTMEIPVRAIRTGERIRDLNLVKFLFEEEGGLPATFVFELGGVQEMGGRMDDGWAASGLPLAATITGTLEFRNTRIPVQFNAVLQAQKDDQIRLTSLTSIPIPMDLLGLPILGFRREFRLQLRSVVEASVDVLLPYTIR